MTENFIPINPDFETRARTSFAKQGIMETVGAKLTKVVPGEVHIEMPFSRAIAQHHGYVHAGIITTIVDNACGFAANTLMLPAAEVLTVEFKVNFLLPAKGERFIAIGKVVKPGRTLTVCSGEVRAYGENGDNLIAIIQTTMFALTK